jgi:hypothetical protein
MNLQCYVHRAKELIAEGNDGMIASILSDPKANRGTVSFCRNCVILSQEAWQFVLFSSPFPQPCSHKSL